MELFILRKIQAIYWIPDKSSSWVNGYPEKERTQLGKVLLIVAEGIKVWIPTNKTELTMRMEVCSL